MKRSAVLAALAVAALLTVTMAAGPAAAAKSDAQLAKAGVIVASDIPPTWQSSPPDGSADKEIEQLAATIPGCKRYLAARKANNRVPHAESREFTTGAEDLSNDVWVFPSEKAAKKAFAGIADSGNADCLTDLFQEALDQDTVSEPTVRAVRVVIEQTDDLPPLGDDIIGYTGGAEFTLTNGTSEQLLLANVVTRVGRSILSYSLAGPAGPNGFSASYNAAIDAAINASVGRMEDGLA